MNLREMKKVKKRHQLNESRTETPGRLEDHMSWKKQKLADIQKALYSDPVDIETLRTAAVSKGGLLTDDVRRKVWPKLLSVNVFDLPAKPAKNIRENHKDHNQVLLDVRRSVSRFPKGMRTAERLVLQEQLIDIILDILRRNPQLHYYQGYHDIAITFLLVVGERMAIALVEKLSKHHLRAEVGTIFALSWLITWYGHVLSDFRHILRLYDFFLASHPLMPIYFAAAIVLYREQEVKSCECDMASVHQLLSRIPQNLPYEQLITRTQTLFTRYPPTLLSSSTTLQSHNSIAISSFKDFQTSTLQQRPDFILRQQRQHLQQRQDAHLALVQQSPWYNSAQPGSAQQLIRMAVWGISATLGAAALAITQTAMNWAPDFLLQLF
ncbi:TBC1 domain family member 20 isoform X2 [Silurus meridionalis]|uniref:TBC1 domain family member 20 isoform X2 n=1 Tax=Silurus meridionalis TaxID=175797 RepID=UPI001EEAB7F5|nr:TBC1 domain family member 20 isoform X2 [Silurus meridionalis]